MSNYAQPSASLHEELLFPDQRETSTFGKTECMGLDGKEVKLYICPATIEVPSPWQTFTYDQGLMLGVKETAPKGPGHKTGLVVFSHYDRIIAAKPSGAMCFDLLHHVFVNCLFQNIQGNALIACKVALPITVKNRILTNVINNSKLTTAQNQLLIEPFEVNANKFLQHNFHLLFSNINLLCVTTWCKTYSARPTSLKLIFY